MVYSLSTKGLKLSDSSLAGLNKHIEKVGKLMPRYDSDAIKIDIVIEKHNKRRSNHINLEIVGLEEEAAREILPKNLAPIYYRCSINLTLPKKPLIVHTESADIDQAINTGFEKLLKDVKKYKEMHFSSNSKHPNRESVKRYAEVYESF